MKFVFQDLLAVSFGELDISPFTVGALILITLFTFLAVGISSLNLIRTASDNEEHD